MLVVECNYAFIRLIRIRVCVFYVATYNPDLHSYVLRALNIRADNFKSHFDCTQDSLRSTIQLEINLWLYMLLHLSNVGEFVACSFDELEPSPY